MDIIAKKNLIDFIFLSCKHKSDMKSSFLEYGYCRSDIIRFILFIFEYHKISEDNLDAFEYLIATYEVLKLSIHLLTSSKHLEVYQPYYFFRKSCCLHLEIVLCISSILVCNVYLLL